MLKENNRIGCAGKIAADAAAGLKKFSFYPAVNEVSDLAGALAPILFFSKI